MIFGLDLSRQGLDILFQESDLFILGGKSILVFLVVTLDLVTLDQRSFKFFADGWDLVLHYFYLFPIFRFWCPKSFVVIG